MFYRNLIVAVLLILFPCQLVSDASFIISPRDTGLAPELNTYSPELDMAFSQVYQSAYLKLYFRDDRGIFAIKDLRNGYIWKTGLDLPFNVDIRDKLDQGHAPLDLPPLEERLNTTFIGIANSMLTIEYYDNANNLRRIGSSAQRNVTQTLNVKNQQPWRAELEIEFLDIDLKVVLEIHVSDTDLTLRIPDSALSGQGLRQLASINLMPFFGASGGRQLFWDDEWQDFSISTAKSAPSGYVVVPDGSGALIRFQDNSVRLSEYRGQVYGMDLSQGDMYRTYTDFSVPPKLNFIPLFGVVHGNRQNAFAGYAVSGGEHLEIVSFPEENTTFYTHAYPRFVYNRLYYQVYNQRGDGYYRILENRNRFDIEMTYTFLHGDGKQPLHENYVLSADYSGIAQAYRMHLDKTGQVPLNNQDTAKTGLSVKAEKDIPMRLDFILSDVSKGIVGHRNQIMTRVSEVYEIIEDLQSAGVHELSIGLIGYARGGTVLSAPGKLRLLSALGSSLEWKQLIEDLKVQGIDISFSRDFSRIAEGQVLPWGNAIRSASGWYTERWTNQANAPVNRFYYAKSEKAVEWLKIETELMLNLGVSSVSIDGLGHTLLSDYPTGTFISRADTIHKYQNAMKNLMVNAELNFYQPNQYLWSYTQRFLHIPVFSTQYLLQTDTIPLLQMILHGSMDMFAPYSNFSFSSKQDILRMIDYNVYPSFLITKESSHALLLTNSAEFSSTQYSNYRDLITEVYGEINTALRTVIAAQWLHREVLSPGIIMNSYNNGVRIVINYTKQNFMFEGHRVSPESAKVFSAKEDKNE